MDEKKEILNYVIEEGKIVVKLDVDKDGKASVELKIDILEVIQEVISKLGK